MSNKEYAKLLCKTIDMLQECNVSMMCIDEDDVKGIRNAFSYLLDEIGISEDTYRKIVSTSEEE